MAIRSLGTSYRFARDSAAPWRELHRNVPIDVVYGIDFRPLVPSLTANRFLEIKRREIEIDPASVGTLVDGAPARQ